MKTLLLHYCPLGLKDGGGSKFSVWVELQVVLLVIYFIYFMGRKWPPKRLDTNSRAEANGLAGQSVSWKKQDQKIMKLV